VTVKLQKQSNRVLYSGGYSFAASYNYFSWGELSMEKNKHITEPDVFGYQVRIVRRGKESSRYFSHKLWGNKGKSLQAAITWRDQMLVVLKGSKTRFLKPPKIKQQPGSQAFPERLSLIIARIRVICATPFSGFVMERQETKLFKSGMLKSHSG